jgi:hypothetical protein
MGEVEYPILGVRGCLFTCSVYIPKIPKMYSAPTHQDRRLDVLKSAQYTFSQLSSLVN